MKLLKMWELFKTNNTARFGKSGRAFVKILKYIFGIDSLNLICYNKINPNRGKIIPFEV